MALDVTLTALFGSRCDIERVRNVADVTVSAFGT